MKLIVVYWNTTGYNGLASIVLNNPIQFDIVVVQEPWFNKQMQTVYCPA